MIFKKWLGMYSDSVGQNSLAYFLLLFSKIAHNINSLYIKTNGKKPAMHHNQNILNKMMLNNETFGKS